jgi:hypothetical protein
LFFCFFQSIIHATPDVLKLLILGVSFSFIPSAISNPGDHLTLLNVLKSYMAVDGDREWCSENFVNPRAMKNAAVCEMSLNLMFCN